MTMANGLRDSIIKVGGWVPVSMELLNPTPLSDEEVARLRVERETREAREDARQAQLIAAGGAVAAVAKWHSPVEHRECAGCDGGDYRYDWPCPTWDLLDEHAPR